MVDCCTMAPLVPVTVMVAGPIAAVGLAVSVITLAEVDEAGENVAVTPAGRPEALNATDPEKLPVGTTVTLDVAVADWHKERVGVSVESAKLALTVSCMLTVSTRLPDVAVIVTGTVPTAAELVAVNVKVVMPDRPGVNVAVTPAGSPLALYEIVPAKSGPTAVSVVLPLPACGTLTTVGFAVSVKLPVENGTGAEEIPFTTAYRLYVPDGRPDGKVNCVVCGPVCITSVVLQLVVLANQTFPALFVSFTIG